MREALGPNRRAFRALGARQRDAETRGTRLALVTSRGTKQGATAMAKIVCVLYDDPVDGYPRAYARGGLPEKRLPEPVERELDLAWHPTVEDMVKVCDVVTINAPLHPQTENLFDDALLSQMKRGAYLVNTARGKICNRDAVVRALESGRLAGYAGDVWFPQPAPNDHPWRTMPNHGMTPHVSGTSLSAQARYAAGTREILECFFEGRPIRNEYLIVDGGKLAGTGAKSYSAGNATRGSEEAARFKMSA
jgi:formate dehydrogenase